MGKWVYIALGVLLVSLLGVIAWRVFGLRESEPTYQGKPLRFWLRGLTTQDVRAWENADAALRQAGTNAIPTLLRLLRAKDSPLTVILVDLARRQHIIKLEYTTAEGWNGAGKYGLVVLGTKAESAVPALIEIVNRNISPMSQASAITVLRNIGPQAKEAVP
jgi:hypothetical protein